MKTTKRCGLLAKKLGMTSVYSDDGKLEAVTVLFVDGVRVVGERNPERDGYRAVCLGAGEKKAHRVAKPQEQDWKAKSIGRPVIVHEFRVEEGGQLPVGAKLSPEHFLLGQYVDVWGVSKGKGFAGGIKRHNFSGLRASHGVSVSHRSSGSTGNCEFPGRVFKNRKMPGHLGGCRVSVQNVRVLGTDVERGLILIRGAVPGSRGTWVIVRDALKREVPKEVPYPACLLEKAEASREHEA